MCADDRVNDYQHYALDAVQSCAADSPDMGAQVYTQGGPEGQGPGRARGAGAREGQGTQGGTGGAREGQGGPRYPGRRTGRGMGPGRGTLLLSCLCMYSCMHTIIYR